MPTLPDPEDEYHNIYHGYTNHLSSILNQLSAYDDRVFTHTTPGLRTQDLSSDYGITRYICYFNSNLRIYTTDETFDPVRSRMGLGPRMDNGYYHLSSDISNKVFESKSTDNDNSSTYGRRVYSSHGRELNSVADILVCLIDLTTGVHLTSRNVSYLTDYLYLVLNSEDIIDVSSYNDYVLYSSRNYHESFLSKNGLTQYSYRISVESGNVYITCPDLLLSIPERSFELYLQEYTTYLRIDELRKTMNLPMPDLPLMSYRSDLGLVLAYIRMNTVNNYVDKRLSNGFGLFYSVHCITSRNPHQCIFRYQSSDYLLHWLVYGNFEVTISYTPICMVHLPFWSFLGWDFGNYPPEFVNIYFTLCFTSFDRTPNGHGCSTH